MVTLHWYVKFMLDIFRKIPFDYILSDTFESIIIVRLFGYGHNVV